MSTAPQMTAEQERTLQHVNDAWCVEDYEVRPGKIGGRPVVMGTVADGDSFYILAAGTWDWLTPRQPESGPERVGPIAEPES